MYREQMASEFFKISIPKEFRKDSERISKRISNQFEKNLTRNPQKFKNNSKIIVTEFRNNPD